MAVVDETWPGVVEVGDVARHIPRRRFGSGVCVVIVVGDVAPALSSSLSMWCGCVSTTTWVTWPHCRRRGCGGCVVIVDLGGPGIVVVIVDVARHCLRGGHGWCGHRHRR